MQKNCTCNWNYALTSSINDRNANRNIKEIPRKVGRKTVHHYDAEQAERETHYQKDASIFGTSKGR